MSVFSLNMLFDEELPYLAVGTVFNALQHPQLWGAQKTGINLNYQNKFKFKLNYWNFYSCIMDVTSQALNAYTCELIASKVTTTWNYRNSSN